MGKERESEREKLEKKSQNKEVKQKMNAESTTVPYGHNISKVTIMMTVKW